MSREIKLDEPLSEEDRQYLLDRWDVNSLRWNMETLGVPAATAIRAETMSYDEYSAHLSDAQNAEEPDPSQTPNPNAGTGSTPIPADISTQQRQGVGLGAQGNGDDPTPYSEGPRAFADPNLSGKAYEDWKVDQLKAEVIKRNELREGSELYADDEPMNAAGTKADFVQRLKDDDEADAPDDEGTPSE